MHKTSHFPSHPDLTPTVASWQAYGSKEEAILGDQRPGASYHSCTGLAAVLATSAVVLAVAGCGKNPTSPELPPTQKAKILTTVSATFVFNGSRTTGTVAFQPTAGGTAVTKNLDEQADLGEIPVNTNEDFTSRSRQLGR